jgi:RNA-directed DNA polymerase
MASATLDPGDIAPLTSSPLERLRARGTLRSAWLRVRESARRSTPATRAEAARFEEHADRHLARIAAQLREGRFLFAQARGIACERPGKGPRPIVVSPIESRIVQRAILDVLRALPGLSAADLEAPTSFGGVPGRGTAGAVNAAIEAVKSGHGAYLRSDIAGFFRNIPRKRALEVLLRHVDDEGFARLLDEATRTELENLAELGEAASIFPEDDTGVPQGCALSTLLGNALLRDFDAQMNGRGIVCLRYVDDFLLLGREAAHVRKAFTSAQRLLGELGLTAYDPAIDPGKAAAGRAAAGFEFLGCEITGGRAAPSRAKREEIFGRVDALLRRSERFFEKPDPREAARLGLAPTLHALGRLIEGFRASYRFCQADDVLAALERAIDGRVEKYLRLHRRSAARDPGQRGSLRGLYSLR